MGIALTRLPYQGGSSSRAWVFYDHKGLRKELMYSHL
jgi:hypothetical protein